MTEQDPMMLALQEEFDVIDADANLAQSRHEGQGWVVEWYLQRLAELDAVAGVHHDQFKTLQSQIDSRRKALDYRYGELFQQEAMKVFAARPDQKKKSVDTLCGRIGCRTTGGKQKLVIDDEVKAIASAEIECPEAVKKTLSRSIIKEQLEAGVAIEGARLVVTDKVESFYAGSVKFDRPLLERTDDEH